jgi:hypothetical protein
LLAIIVLSTPDELLLLPLLLLAELAVGEVGDETALMFVP